MDTSVRHAASVRVRHAVFASCIGGLVLLSGCARYQPSPLDLQQHAEEFRHRAEQLSVVAEHMRSSPSPDMPDAHVFDVTDGISMDEAEAIALFYNADLRTERLRAGLTLATKENAGLWDDPELGFDGAEILSPASPFEYGVTLQLTVPVSGRLRVERARADAAHESQLRRIASKEWATRMDLRRAWIRWSAQVERERMLSEAIDYASDVEQVVDRLVQAGEMSRVEARLLKIDIEQLHTDQLQAEIDRTQAKQTLLALLGLSADGNLVFESQIHAEPPPLPEQIDTHLIEHSPEVAALIAEYEVAEESLRLEVQKQYPDITIGSGYSNEDDHRLLLGLSLPVPILNANRAGIAEAAALRDIARADAERALEDICNSLVSARSMYEAATSQRMEYEHRVLTLLDEQSRELAALAELGEVNALMLVETLSRITLARVRALELQQQESELAINIAEILGPRDMPEHLESNTHEPTQSGESR
ncbi:MAG: TolC family protein [Phycisphaeraceae bacterium]|nr:TolC family protein [Phycisphaerales bacterium]MCB9859220.1 TolC family protein [Phycisphaeraceae bacterium]